MKNPVTALVKALGSLLGRLLGRSKKTRIVPKPIPKPDCDRKRSSLRKKLWSWMKKRKKRRHGHD